MRPAVLGPMPRSPSANIVPCAITATLRSFEMLGALARAALASERVEQHRVRAPVERRELEPAFENREPLGAAGRQRLREPLQDRGVARAKPAPLRDQPAVELRIAIEL